MRAAVLILVFLLSLPVLVNVETRAMEAPVRSDLLPVIFENGTFIISRETGSQEYGTVTIGMNADIRVIGATLKATRVISSSNTTNSTLLISDFGGIPAILSIKGGRADLSLHSIQISGSRIAVAHSQRVMQKGEDGFDTQLVMRTSGGGIVIDGSEITVSAEDGAPGDSSTFPGNGGDVQLTIEDLGGGSVKISDSLIALTGGKGGSSMVTGSVSGYGGSADILIDGSSVNLQGLDLKVLGGNAGTVSGGSEGNNGGSASTSIRSQYNITLYSTDIIALGGDSTKMEPQPTPSFVRLTSQDGSVVWDADKNISEQHSTLSRVDTLSLQVDAEKDAFMHEVDLKDVPPTPLGETTINIYWWFEVSILDTYGSPISGAWVYYLLEDDPFIYPGSGNAPVTDEKGRASHELLARTNGVPVKYRFMVSLPDGLDPFISPLVYNTKDENKAVRMDLDVITIETWTDMTDPQKDTWTIEGTTLTMISSPIVYMDLYVGDEKHSTAEDLADRYEPAFSRWSLDINVSSLRPGTHVLELRVLCGEHMTARNWTVEFPISIFNHPPILENVQFTDSLGRFGIETGKIYPVRVSSLSPTIELGIDIYEPDHSSDVLGPRQGALLSSVKVEIAVNEKAGIMFSSEVAATSLDSYSQGRGTHRFFIDTTHKNDDYRLWEDGRYVMTVEAWDDAGLRSDLFQVRFDLHFDQAPLLLLRAGEDGSISPKGHPTYSGEFFSFETPIDRDLKVWFDLTGCKDLDDPSYFPHPAMDRSWENLTCTVSLSLNGSEPWVIFGPEKGAPGFFHTFDLSNFSKDDTAVFEMTLHVEDPDRIENELKVLIEVQVGPPVDRESKPPVWVLLLIMAVWIAAMVASFAIVLPIYNRRRRDKIRRLLKDPRLYGVTIQAMKGEKPTDHFVSEREIKRGLVEKMEAGSLDAGKYETIMDDWKDAQEKVNIISGETR
ncbi:MAG: hypothetical protein ACMUHM_01370 [Thermoplasmatota archaeon]